MTKIIQQAFGLAWMLFSMALFAQSDRPSCAMLKNLDLKPLLGADHDAPVAFGTESCRAESKSPGRLLVFAVFDQPPGGAKNWLANNRKLTAKFQGSEVNIVAEPALGPDAYSVRSRGELREVEFYAMKGSRAVVLKGSWAIGAPLGDAGVKQLQQLTQASLDKLP
jgi:hypothetical protein